MSNVCIPPNSCSIDASLVAAAAHLLNEETDHSDHLPTYGEIALERLLEALILFDKAFIVGWVSPRYSKTLLVSRLRQLPFPLLPSEELVDVLPVPTNCREWVIGEIKALAEQGLTDLLKQALYAVPGASRSRHPYHQRLFAEHLRVFEDSDWFFHDPEAQGNNRQRWLRAKIQERLEHSLDHELLPYFPHERPLRETWKLVYAVEFLCRGLAYQRWSSYSQIPYLCHPFRTCLVNLDTGMAAAMLDAREAIAFVEGFRSKLLRTVLHGIPVCWEPKLPSLLAAVLRECGSREEIMTTAMQIRNSDEARSYRTLMAEINCEFKNGNMKKLLRYSKERAKLETNLCREFGARQPTGDIGVSFWNISMNFKLPGLLYWPVYLRPHLRLIYNLSKAVATISSLRPDFQRLFRRP